MYKYSTVFELLFHEDIGQYISYGIICVNTLTEEIISYISDVSTKKDFVCNLAEKFTKLQLSPCHFKDALEDALL